MENNFKGTKITEEDDLNLCNLVNEWNIHLNGDFIGQAFNEEDGNTFYDGLLVRQQIDCSITDLLEQRNKLRDALIEINQGLRNQAPLRRVGDSDYKAMIYWNKTASKALKTLIKK